MTIFNETLPVANMFCDGEWQMDYDANWEARREAFPIWVQSGPFSADRLRLWLQIYFRKRLKPRSVSRESASIGWRACQGAKNYPHYPKTLCAGSGPVSRVNRTEHRRKLFPLSADIVEKLAGLAAEPLKSALGTR